MFKKVISTLALSGFLTLAVVAPVMALECSVDCATGGGQCNAATGQCIYPKVTSLETLMALINTIGNWIFAALVAVAVIFMIVAGFFYITGGGNEENIRKGKNMLISALIGVAIALAARGLVAIVMSLLTR
jgi:hypothetical protein